MKMDTRTNTMDGERRRVEQVNGGAGRGTERVTLALNVSSMETVGKGKRSLWSAYLLIIVQLQDLLFTLYSLQSLPAPKLFKDSKYTFLCTLLRSVKFRWRKAIKNYAIRLNPTGGGA